MFIISVIKFCKHFRCSFQHHKS